MTTTRINELATARNTTPAHLVMTFDSSDTDLANAIRTDAGVDHITDSVIDDIMDELQTAECRHCDDMIHPAILADDGNYILVDDATTPGTVWINDDDETDCICDCYDCDGHPHTP